MDSKSFENLLLDLYDVYNTSKKKGVERLVNSYNGREFDAIKTILIRYNYKGHPGFNENALRDDYVHYLIKSYSDGKAPLSKENRLKESEEEEKRKLEAQRLEEEKKQKEKEEIASLGESTKKQIQKEVEKLQKKMEEDIKRRMDNIQNFLTSKKKEFMEFSGHTTEIITEVQQDKSHTKVNIENLNFADADVKLPPENVLEDLAKGTRLIVNTSEGRVCGIEVKDITYDCVSHPGEVVKEMLLQRI